MKVLICVAFLASQLCTLNGQYSQKDKALNSRLNYFDTDLLRYAAEDRPGNIMLSPASIKSVLAMILEGAGGKTEAEIRSALRLSPNKRDYREQLHLYLQSLQAHTPGTQLENANAVFVSTKLGRQVKQEYDQMIRKVYMSELTPLDFLRTDKSAQHINKWVKEKTHGLIPEVIQPGNINPTTDILLLNALYFKSNWARSFFEGSRSSCFYTQGQCRKVAMMSQVDEVNYAFVDNLRAHAVELPYVHGKYSMIVLVPAEREGLGTLIRDLPYMSLPQISDLMQRTEVDLSLPRFQVTYEEDLVPILKKMKINEAFTKDSNLTGVFQGESAQINALFHKVYIDVNEQGTEAAASTGAVVVPLISDNVQLLVDRPFVFFIRDNELGSVLFEGKIEEPTRWEDSPRGRKPAKAPQSSGNRKQGRK